MIKKITVVLLFEKSKFISVGHDAGQAFMIYKRSDNLILRNEISKDDIYLVLCYRVYRIVSRGITNSRFRLTQSKPYIFLVSGPNKSIKKDLNIN